MKKTRYIVNAAIIAAVYAALTLVLQPISFGAFQIRISEGLTLLPVLMPAAVPGLAVGCLTANLLGGACAADIIIGSLATFAAALCTARVKSAILGGAFPVLFNSLLTAPVIVYFYMGGGDAMFYLTYMAGFALFETVAVYGVGLPLTAVLKKVIKERYR